MTTNKFYFRLFMLLGIVFALNAYDKDDDIVLPEGKLIENTELQSVLKTMGFEFDAGKLVMNEKATSTTTLDLSGKELTSCKGLDIFPALKEVNLANNKIEEFDFDMLPAKITKIDLQGNKLYEFKNLKPERKLEKLYLPETAKYNMDEVLAYYTENKGKVDMQIAMNSKLEKYSYLRTVPDDILRADLKERFPSVFTGDKIDLSKEMAVLEAGNGLMLSNGTDVYDKDFTSLEGVQYITNYSNFRGSVFIFVKKELKLNLDYFKVSKTISKLALQNLNVKEQIDWTEATSLEFIAMIDVTGIKKIDISTSEKYAKVIDMDFAKGALIKNCPDLEEITFPEYKEQMVTMFAFVNLPKLKKLDISKVGSVGLGMSNQLKKLPSCKITFPSKLKVYPNPEASKPELTVDASVAEKSEVKAFIEAHGDGIKYKVETNKSTKSRLKSAFSNSGITGNYSGILEPIMNGKKYDNVNSTFTLTETATNKMNIYLPPFKVGKMPGKLHIDIKNTSFTTASNGDISFTGSQDPCVYLKLPFYTAEIKGDYNGTLINDQFHFFIHAKKQVLFWDITADVTFNGTKE